MTEYERGYQDCREAIWREVSALTAGTGTIVRTGKTAYDPAVMMKNAVLRLLGPDTPAGAAPDREGDERTRWCGHIFAGDLRCARKPGHGGDHATVGYRETWAGAAPESREEAPE